MFKNENKLYYCYYYYYLTIESRALRTDKIEEMRVTPPAVGQLPLVIARVRCEIQYFRTCIQ